MSSNTMAGRWKDGDLCTDLKIFSLKVIFINSAHISLARASSMAMPNFENVGKYSLTIRTDCYCVIWHESIAGKGSLEILVKSPNG